MSSCKSVPIIASGSTLDYSIERAISDRGPCRTQNDTVLIQNALTLDRTEKHSTMPDSPADVKSQSRLTPPTMPPPPTMQGAPRTSSFTPTTLTNGTSHSPTALNGAPSPPNGFSNGPSSSLANQQLPPACGARQLSKLKRFLTTLQQFGNDISPEIGERVRTLVLGLVVMTNGTSHSPTALNGAPSPPNGFSNGPSSSLANQQLPPACGARQLSKLKRFLTTLQQFGNDISPEIGERVRTLVLGLVVSQYKKKKNYVYFK
ncbi:UNVERIFIED_CONTAM: hypothetical protein FKN15_028073 [Acipenser sinensis]